MNWEEWTERAIHNGGFWLVHLNYVAVWALLSIALSLFSLRLLVQWILMRRHGSGGAPPGWEWRVGAAAAALVPAALMSGYMALRPDAAFYTTIADAAFQADDCVKAAAYYAPLVDWGSRDLEVHTRLVACQLRLGHLRSALRTLDEAQSLPGGDSPALRLWAARALEQLGRRDEARRELDRVYQMVPPGPDRDRVARERERLQRGSEAGER